MPISLATLAGIVTMRLEARYRTFASKSMEGVEGLGLGGIRLNNLASTSPFISISTSMTSTLI